MTRMISIEQLKAFIDHQLKPSEWEAGQPTKPFVTISRQAGAGGTTVSQKLVDYLERARPYDGAWTVFDKTLAEKVLEDHFLPKRIAEYMPEAKADFIQGTVEELLGLHPPIQSLVENTARTILSLAEMGHVVLVGRGSHVVTAKLSQGFHVRLVGSMEKRTVHLAHYLRVTRQEAGKLVKSTDHGRRAYLKQHYGKDIDDPTIYHLIINTDWVSYDEAAAMIGEAVLRRAKINPPALHTETS